MPSGLHGALGGLRLDELESFVVLAEELHFGRAAQRLHITPAGLSRRITHLERALNVSLVVRTTRSVRLTKQGTQFAWRARRVLDELTDRAG